MSQLTKQDRQVAMVMDLNKCLGCQTCTVACKKLWNKDQGTDYSYWNNVETRPGKGFPRNWSEQGGRTATGLVQRGQLGNLDEDYGRAWSFNHSEVIATDGKNDPSWIKPEGDPTWGPNWDEDEGAGEYPQENHYFYLPRICNHCTHPACLEACPRAAINKRKEDGIVLVDQDRCHGYRFCVEACPYKKAFFDPLRNVAAKCIFCMPRVEKGIAPACARQCVGRMRFVGYLDDPDGPIHQLVNEWKVALPLHPEFGTQPNVFYVPPSSPPRLDDRGRPTAEPRIPIEYLQSLFGEQVNAALATIESERNKKKNGDASELMDLLIAYKWQDSFKLEEDVQEEMA
jgi:DMSO reductase family type II enzyme iron-sulfur subunit